MTQIVPATAVLGAGQTGLTIGYRVLDIDRVEYSAFSTTGVAETNILGTYSKTGGVVAPNAGGYIIWGTSGVDLAEDEINPALAWSGSSPGTGMYYEDLVEETSDTVLKRDWTLISGEASRSVINALRFMRNKWSVSGTTLTVTKEDDVTTAWTSTLSTDAAADPVSGSDPS